MQGMRTACRRLWRSFNCKADVSLQDSSRLEAASHAGTSPEGSSCEPSATVLENRDMEIVVDSTLRLEVIAGPSAGLSVLSQHVKDKQSSPITVGRLPRNDLVLDDEEVSGKHALISWNSEVCQWELVDMGSLNGTFVNCRSVAATHPMDAPARQRGNPVGLVNGDVITLGTTSKLLVKVLDGHNDSQLVLSSPPRFEVGVAADPMTTRRGGVSLPMEDVPVCEWPLHGSQEFGVFCIFDGHGGAAAARTAGRLMSQNLSSILSVEERKAKVLSQCDAAQVLLEAFRQTEASLEHEYEGCTATVLLVWWDGVKKVYYAQCANVGDSMCVFSVGELHIPMTEDHRLTSVSERCRLSKMGKQLKDGETRLWGLNIARALGDKFLKREEECFSPEPFVSEVVKIEADSRAIAVMASDGLWDVMSQGRALNFALAARDGKSSTVIAEGSAEGSGSPENAEGIAEMLVDKARHFRTKDNTTVIVVDFGSNNTSGNRTV